MTAEAAPGTSRRRLEQAKVGGLIAFGLLVFVLEAFILDGWLLALVACGGLVLPAIFPRRFGGRVPWPVPVIGLLVLGGALAVTHLNHVRASDQGRAVAKACDRFRAEHGDYPENLAQLVPGYLSAVPAGKFTYGSHWSYRRDPTAKNPPILRLSTERLPILMPLLGVEWFDFRTGELWRHAPW